MREISTDGDKASTATRRGVFLFTFKLKLAFAAAIGLPCLGVAQAQTKQSVYTNLDPKFCRTLKPDTSEAGEYLGRCNGTGGYSLLVAEGDLRQNLTVTTPKGTKHSLELWTVVSSAFLPKSRLRVRAPDNVKIAQHFSAGTDGHEFGSPRSGRLNKPNKAANFNRFFSRPLHGLVGSDPTFAPALKYWAIFRSPAARTTRDF